jgi:hypothetical protein
MKRLLSVPLLLLVSSPATANLPTVATTSVLERSNLLTDSRTGRAVEPRIDENNTITFDDPNYFYDYSWLSFATY